MLSPQSNRHDIIRCPVESQSLGAGKQNTHQDIPSRSARSGHFSRKMFSANPIGIPNPECRSVADSEPSLDQYAACWYYLQHEGRAAARRASCRRLQRLRGIGRMAPRHSTSRQPARFQVPVGARGRWTMRPPIRQRVRKGRSPAYREEGTSLRFHNRAAVVGRFLERSGSMEVLTCGR